MTALCLPVMGNVVIPYGAGVVMDGQGGLVQYTPAGFVEVGKVGAGVATMAAR